MDGLSAESFQFKQWRVPVDLANLTGAGQDSWEILTRGHFEYLERVVGIHSEHSFLEIGCGVGRDAMALTEVLRPPGGYLGVDIIRRSIDWCRANITSEYSHFRFEHFNVRDALHNPEGTISTRDIRIPLEDESIDRIILWSVLTHMFEADIVHYFREFARVLKPDGLVMATCFMLDDWTLRKIARNPSLDPQLKSWTKYRNGCYINVPSMPEGAVAFTPKKLKEMVTAGGLRFDRDVLLGQWSGNVPGEGFGHDVMVLRR